MTEPTKAEVTIGTVNTVIGPGIVLHGTLRSVTGNPASRVVVMGEMLGDIFTDGILEISKGAVVRPDATIECLEMIVAGKIVGDNVTIRTQLFNLLSTGRVDIDTLFLPPGGLEQLRGSVLNARLDMSPNPCRAATKTPMPGLDVFNPTSNRDATAPVPLPVTAESLVHKPAQPPELVPDLSDPSELAGSLPTFGRSRGDGVYAGIVLPDEAPPPTLYTNVELVAGDGDENSRRELANELATAAERARHQFALKMEQRGQKRLEELNLSDQHFQPSAKFVAPSVAN